MLHVTVDSYLLQNLRTEGNSCKTHRLAYLEDCLGRLLKS